MVHNPKLESKTEESIYRKPIRPLILTAILATLVVGGISLYTVQRFRNANSQKIVPAANAVEVKTVTALGRLEPKGEVIKLSAPANVEGNRVEKLLVKEGDRLKPGQMIAVLDSRDRLQASLLEAQEAVRVAQVNLVRVKAGAKQGEIEAQKAAIARLEAEQNTEIEAQKATIARLEAEQNTEIEAQKATIARLEAEQNTEIEAQKATIAEAQAQLVNAQAEIQRYEKLYQEGAIAISLRDTKNLTVATAQQKLNEARANLKRIQSSRQQQIIEAQANLNRIQSSRKQQLAEAQANLKRIQSSFDQQIKEGKATLDKIAEVRPVDVLAAQAEVNRAVAAMKRAQENLKMAYVQSPQEGQVFKIHTFPGELVSNEGIAEIGQTGQMYAVAEVYQSDIGKVRLGQRVRLVSESLNGELLGTVDRIGLQVLRQNVINSDPSSNIDARVVEVHVRLDPTSTEKASRFTNLQVKAVIEL
ncbi:HlyD family efflux transporter periplasmic adaptor subunit [Iningainema tapete]|uniref:Biotin/lipoyl-binding protein n=1 Tax=Iningainema tapete BLCC-T55 TaxID=2748662 RepID=A0A8J7C925_9CYAN|nr:HlyD family efflux transporter periplasmic adaptor subunit [Iningainema tapete]MBD2775456.1 biotin/lipoyl-binding protein [Iningainema tapete BLCC-T55]